MKKLANAVDEGRQKFVLMYNTKLGTRAKHRQEQSQLVKESPTLAEKFPTLKTLKVRLRFFERRLDGSQSEIKYTVNLLHAKSIFRFGCRNPECVNGDFDLTQDLARAVAARERKTAGELRCQGWRTKESIDSIRCHKLLQFELTLGY
jgi:hypothetical protein